MKSAVKTTRYLVYGLGKSGLAAIQLLKGKGISPDQILTFEDRDSDEKLSSYLSDSPGTLVLSPGVPIQSARVKKILASGWSLSSEIDLACEHLTTEKIIGITGSVGKSTVTSLLGAAALTIDPNAFVGGNLGIPFSQYAVDLLNGRTKAKWIILELSSYQLENSSNLKLDYSLITYLAANHLERYENLEHYYDTKLSIETKTKEILFLNTESADLKNRIQKLKKKFITSDSKNHDVFSKAKKMKLWGAHNLENVALALTLVQKLNWGPSSEKAILEFGGLSHRLQYLGSFHGVDFLNDSKATAIDSVLVAVHACAAKLPEKATLHLLIGGRDKNLPWSQLSVIAKDTRCKIHFFGECREIAKAKSGLSGNIFTTLKEALPKVLAEVQKNDIVLLSPGGTSLDEFKNFEDRGEFFSQSVLAWSK